MAEPQLPVYFNVLDEQIKSVYRDVVAARVLERTVVLEELDDQQLLGAHLLLGQYQQHRGSVEEPGVLLLPTDLAARGIVLSRKKESQLVEAIDEQVAIAAQSHHFRPEYRDADGTTIIGEVEYEPIDGFGLYKQKLDSLKRHEDVDNMALSEVIEAGREAALEIEELHDIGEATDKLSELEALVEAGTQARNALVEANLSLAIYFAKRYTPKNGMTFDDIVQICNEALIDAAGRYEYREEASFATHYKWYVLKHFSKSYTDEYAPIRIPQSQRDRVKAYQEAVSDYKVANNNATPKFEDLYAKLGFPLNQNSVEILKAALNVGNIVSIDMRSEMNMNPTPEESETDETTEIPRLFKEYPEFVIDDSEIVAEEKEIAREVRGMLANLSDRERRIIEERFGIRTSWNALGEPDYTGAAPRTLEDIGHDFNLSRERIRVIEYKTLSKLRHPFHSRSLRGLLEGTLYYVEPGQQSDAYKKYQGTRKGKREIVGHNPYTSPGHDQ